MTDSTNPKDALGVKKAPVRFVPPALALIASDAMADGAAKYGAFNWRETAVRLTVYLEAIERHLLALKDGQDRAEDSGHLHLSHIAACCAIIADAAGIGKLIDDRPSAGPAADMLRERDKTVQQIDEAAAGVASDDEFRVSSLGEHLSREPAPFSGTPADVIDAELRAEQPHTAGLVGAKVRVTVRGLSIPRGSLGTIVEVFPSGAVTASVPGRDGLAHLLADEFEVLP